MLDLGYSGFLVRKHVSRRTGAPHHVARKPALPGLRNDCQGPVWQHGDHDSYISFRNPKEFPKLVPGIPKASIAVTAITAEVTSIPFATTGAIIFVMLPMFLSYRSRGHLGQQGFGGVRGRESRVALPRTR